MPHTRRRSLLLALAFALAAPQIGLAQQRPGTVTPRRPAVAPQGRPAAQARPAQAQQQDEDDNETRTAQRRQAVQRGQVPMRLDFDRVEIVEVVKTISDLTGRNFILPDNIRGRITILSPTPVTPDQAYAAFLAALSANNLAVYQTGRFHKIVPAGDAIRSNIPTIIDQDGSYPLNEQMVTRLFRLEHIEADQITGIINNLISRDGEVHTFPPDILIINDLGLNLHRIERIVRQLDQTASGADEIRIIQIRYASAPDIAQKLMEIFQQTGTATRPTPQRAQSPAARRAAARRAQQQQQQEGQPEGVAISQVLADERTNKIIVIADQRSFERIEELISHLDVPTEGEGQVHVHYLMNANAEELASTLSQLTGTTRAGAGAAARQPRPRAAQGSEPNPAELFEGEMKISADPGTNSLVIVSSFNDYRALRRVIDQLDIPRRQVFVEAVIMEVSADISEELGLAFHTGQAPTIGGEQAPVILGTQLGGLNSLSLASLLQFGGFLAGIQGPPIPGTEGLPVSVPSFGVVLHALQRDSHVNVLSTPHILTSDNEEAEISVGQNVPFQAGFAPPGIGNLLGGGTTGEDAGADALLRGFGGLGGIGNFFAPIQRQNVELRLRIRPQINESDYVRLAIDEQIEEIASVDRILGPTTSRRTAQTTVVAKDGQTIVLGGLMQERNVESVQKVPLLGDVPVIGRLFRTTEVRTVKTNLLLFLTPYIIKDESDFQRILRRKMEERQQFVEQFYGMNGDVNLDFDYARKVGPLGHIQRTLEEERLAPENGGPGRGVQVIEPRRTLREERFGPGERPTDPWPESRDEPDAGDAPAVEEEGEPVPEPSEEIEEEESAPEESE
jgi:general secretion pathway protein D